MTTSIRDGIRAFILDAFYAPADLGDDASLIDTGTMDSTGVLELIVFLEQRWGISVGDREIHPDYFDSILRITAFVERKVAELSDAPSPSSRARGGAPPSPPLGSHV